MTIHGHNIKLAEQMRKHIPEMSPLRCGSVTLPCFGFNLGFLANEGDACGVIAVYVCSISTFSRLGSLIFCGLYKCTCQC